MMLLLLLFGLIFFPAGNEGICGSPLECSNLNTCETSYVQITLNCINNSFASVEWHVLSEGYDQVDLISLGVLCDNGYNDTFVRCSDAPTGKRDLSYSVPLMEGQKCSFRACNDDRFGNICVNAGNNICSYTAKSILPSTSSEWPSLSSSFLSNSITPIFTSSLVAEISHASSVSSDTFLSTSFPATPSIIVAAGPIDNNSQAVVIAVVSVSVLVPVALAGFVIIICFTFIHLSTKSKVRHRVGLHNIQDQFTHIDLDTVSISESVITVEQSLDFTIRITAANRSPNTTAAEPVTKPVEIAPPLLAGKPFRSPGSGETFEIEQSMKTDNKSAKMTSSISPTAAVAVYPNNTCTTAAVTRSSSKNPPNTNLIASATPTVATTTNLPSDSSVPVKSNAIGATGSAMVPTGYVMSYPMGTSPSVDGCIANASDISNLLASSNCSSSYVYSGSNTSGYASDINRDDFGWDEDIEYSPQPTTPTDASVMEGKAPVTREEPSSGIQINLINGHLI